MFKIFAKIALVTVVAATLGLAAIEPSSADDHDFPNIGDPTQRSCSGGCHGS